MQIMLGLFALRSLCQVPDKMPLLTPVPHASSVKHPLEMLDQLRRASLTEFAHLKEHVAGANHLPVRGVPAHSVGVQQMRSNNSPGGDATQEQDKGGVEGKGWSSDEDEKTLPSENSSQSTSDTKPVFQELDFGRAGSARAQSLDDAVSPTNTRV